MKNFTISSKTLFDKNNNPTLRLDLKYAEIPAMIESGEIDKNPRKTLQTVIPNNANFQRWVNSLRTKTTIDAVEKHIKSQLTQQKLTPELQNFIKQAAINLVKQEIDIMQEEVDQQNKKIETFKNIINADLPIRC